MDELQPRTMKVAELRDELAKRGLRTTGVKHELIERLETAIGDTRLDGGDGRAYAVPKPAPATVPEPAPAPQETKTASASH